MSIRYSEHSLDDSLKLNTLGPTLRVYNAPEIGRYIPFPTLLAAIRFSSSMCLRVYVLLGSSSTCSNQLIVAASKGMLMCILA